MKDRPSTGSTKCGCPDGARTTDVIRIIGTYLYRYKNIFRYLTSCRIVQPGCYETEAPCCLMFVCVYFV